MKCPRCGTDNRAGRRFCADCGVALAVACAACGFGNEPGEKFCGGCGAPIAGPAPESAPRAYTPVHLAEKILGSRTALEGERKLVTVVFVDLASSTALAERVGPDAMHGLLNRFFEIGLEHVHRYEGTINQFLGDGFMALFGAPVAHEDHARRAVLAAVGLRDALQRQGGGLSARIGINTGLVVVGAIGDNLRMDYTAIGDTTNLAARLQQLAEPGTIVIGEATTRAMRGVARIEALPPTLVKGKTDKVTPYRVIGLAAARVALESEGDRTLSRFVGREAELGALERLFAEVIRGHGQVVGIVGDPGLGKSRLLLEFRRAVSIGSANYVEGRCLSYGTTTPYLPLVDVVRMTTGISDADTPEAIDAKVRRLLADLGIAGDDAAPCLLHLLGVKEGAARVAGLNAETLKARIFAVLDEMALRSSRRRPLVVAIEDLHWVDRSSESYLASLVDALAGAPILLIATYRPGYQPPWLGKSYATQVALRPLAARDDRAILESSLRDRQVSDAVIDRIVEKAEGNPFFLEELARIVVEHGLPTSIPETVQDVLMARIDRLPEHAKRLLQTAAVIGRHVSPRVLAAVAPEPATLTAGVQDLKRLEFLYEERRSDEPELTFKHVLTQEVAYESVVLSRRRTLHAAVGAALEKLHAGQIDQVIDRLAHHYARTDDSLKAVAYLTRVADKATRSFAHTEAVAALDDAAVHATRLPESTADRWLVEIVVIKAQVLHFLGRRPESVELLLAHEEHRARVNDAQLSARYFFWLGFAYSFLGDRERAPRMLERAVDLASQSGDRVTGGNARIRLGTECYFSGDHRQGIEHSMAAAELLVDTDARSALGMAYNLLGMNQDMLSEFGAALRSFERAEALGRELGDRRLTSLAVAMRANEVGATERWDHAVPVSEEALALAPDAFEAALCTGLLGHTLLRCGRIEDALARLEAAIDAANRYRSIQVRSWFYAWLGEAYVAAGRVEAGRTCAREALELARSARHPWGVALAERSLGLAALAGGEAGDAGRWLRSSLATSEGMGNRAMQVRNLIDLAALDVDAGDRATAAARLARALALALEIDAPALVDRVKTGTRDLGLTIES